MKARAFFMFISFPFRKDTAEPELMYPGTTAAERLFPHRDPLRQVFIAGVEVKAAFHELTQGYTYSGPALLRRGCESCEVEAMRPGAEAIQPVNPGEQALGDRLKTGHLWSVQNRPLWMA
jgi:hypothetical protein